MDHIAGTIILFRISHTLHTYNFYERGRERIYHAVIIIIAIDVYTLFIIIYTYIYVYRDAEDIRTHKSRVRMTRCYIITLYRRHEDEHRTGYSSGPYTIIFTKRNEHRTDKGKRQRRDIGSSGVAWKGAAAAATANNSALARVTAERFPNVLRWHVVGI